MKKKKKIIRGFDLPYHKYLLGTENLNNTNSSGVDSNPAQGTNSTEGTGTQKGQGGGGAGGGGNFMDNVQKIGGYASMFDSLAQGISSGIDATRSGTSGTPQVLVEGVLGGQSGSHLGSMWTTRAKTNQAIDYVNTLGGVTVDDSSNEALLNSYNTNGQIANLNIDTKLKDFQDFVFDPLSFGLTSLFGMRESAADRQARINRAINAANARRQQALSNAAMNVQTNRNNALLANYAAFGGPIFNLGYSGSSALDYDLAKDAQHAKMLSAQNKGTTTQYIPPTEFAEGGKIYIKPSKRGTFTAAAKSRGMGVQEFASKVLANKDNYSPAMVKKANFARNASHWHNDGGMLLSDFFTNGVDIINNGGTHEQNPNEGVPMGIAPDGKPNLVEEGEAIFNDYVFSHRLKVPKAVRNKYKLRGPKDMTFAEAFIQAQKESEERPNDPISKNGLDNLAMILAQTQEMVRNAPKREHKAAKGGHLFKEGDILEKYRENVPEENIPDDAQADVDAFWENTLGKWDTPRNRVLYMENPELFEDSKFSPLRYAPIGASASAVLSDAFGATNNPVIFDELPGYYNVGFSPLANYIPVTHTDTRYQQIQNAQQAAATRNALMQSTSPSRNNAILAADFNAQIANGELLRQGELQDYERMLRREEFNRATNQQNTNWGLNTALANREYGLNLGNARLKQAMATDESSNNMMAAKARNIEGLAEGLGELGREKDAMAWRDMLLRAGVYGTQSEKPMGWSDEQWMDYIRNTRKAACGGKIKRRKKGLTY